MTLNEILDRLAAAGISREAATAALPDWFEPSEEAASGQTLDLLAAGLAQTYGIRLAEIVGAEPMAPLTLPEPGHPWALLPGPAARLRRLGQALALARRGDLPADR